MGADVGRRSWWRDQGRLVLNPLSVPAESRGARIRTEDLADPNGALYQAELRPEAPSLERNPVRGLGLDAANR